MSDKIIFTPDDSGYIMMRLIRDIYDRLVYPDTTSCSWHELEDRMRMMLEEVEFEDVTDTEEV